MNIGPSREFQEAFREVFGVECVPGNLIPAIRASDPRLAAVYARAVPAQWLQQATRRDRIAALIEQHPELIGRDGPGPEMMNVIWRHFPQATKVEIHNICADRPQEQ